MTYENLLRQLLSEDRWKVLDAKRRLVKSPYDWKDFIPLLPKCRHPFSLHCITELVLNQTSSLNHAQANIIKDLEIKTDPCWLLPLLKLFKLLPTATSPPFDMLWTFVKLSKRGYIMGQYLRLSPPLAMVKEYLDLHWIPRRDQFLNSICTDGHLGMVELEEFGILQRDPIMFIITHYPQVAAQYNLTIHDEQIFKVISMDDDDLIRIISRNPSVNLPIFFTSIGLDDILVVEMMSNHPDFLTAFIDLMKNGREMDVACMEMVKRIHEKLVKFGSNLVGFNPFPLIRRMDLYLGKTNKSNDDYLFRETHKF